MCAEQIRNLLGIRASAIGEIRNFIITAKHILEEESG